jgi:lysophospholipase L1-like esterase
MLALNRGAWATRLGSTLAIGCCAAGVLASERSYLSLGDSVGFGFTRLADMVPSFGDQGFVAPYADWLGTQWGARPNVINLAIPGESSSSYFTGGELGTLLNLNYVGFESQQSKLLEKIDGEHAAGRSIDEVSLILGGNDLIDLVFSPEFGEASEGEQIQLVLQTLDTLGTHYTSLLDELTTALPDAQLTLLNYYNPWAAVPESEFYDLSFLLVDALNAVIADRAAAYDARLVDIHSVFAGHEAEWTYMRDDPLGENIHPRPEGYAAIAQALIPEPSSLLLLLLAGGLLRRR